MAEPLDAVDWRVLCVLSEGSRIGMLELSRRAEVARGTAQAHVDRLVANGVITSFSPHLDVRAMGYGVLAFTTMDIAQGRLGDVIAHPEFGRGKVETVLRSSLLVRFSLGGLKSLMRQILFDPIPDVRDLNPSYPDCSEAGFQMAEVRWSRDGSVGLRFADDFDIGALAPASHETECAPGVLKPAYLETELRDDSPWAARFERLSLTDFIGRAAKLEEAEDWLWRRASPIDEDLGAWMAFLGAWAAHADPFEHAAPLLEREGMGDRVVLKAGDAPAGLSVTIGATPIGQGTPVTLRSRDPYGRWEDANVVRGVAKGTDGIANTMAVVKPGKERHDVLALVDKHVPGAAAVLFGEPLGPAPAERHL